MGYILSELGIYPAAIEKVGNTCEYALEDAKKIINEIGSKNEYDALDFNLDDAAKDRMCGDFDFNNMTNSIIGAYLETTASALNNCKTLNDLGISFETYTNCDDSHLTIIMDDGNGVSSTECYESELITAVQDIVAEKVAELAQDEGIEGTSEDMKDYYLNELFECIQEGKLTGVVKEDLEPFRMETLEEEHNKEIACESAEIMKVDDKFYVIDLTDENLYEAVNRSSKESPELAKLIKEYGGADKVVAADECPYEVYAQYAISDAISASKSDSKVHLRFTLMEHDIDVAVPLTEKESKSFAEKLASFDKKQEYNHKIFAEKLASSDKNTSGKRTEPKRNKTDIERD